jgi:hypothetical protein
MRQARLIELVDRIAADVRVFTVSCVCSRPLGFRMPIESWWTSGLGKHS